MLLRDTILEMFCDKIRNLTLWTENDFGDEEKVSIKKAIEDTLKL